MAKLKITNKQYNAIILHEQKNRLNSSENILNENTEVLEEGWKEVVLGVAMMLGVGLTGQNKVLAQNAVKNETTMAQIKSTLEDKTKTAELVKLLKQKGMKDAETKLADNAEKVMDTYNKIAADDDIKYKVDVRVVKNLQQLKGVLGYGYALKNAEMTSDTINSEQSKVIISDTVELNLGSDNLFVTGGFTLSQAGMDTIKTAIEGINAVGGTIQSIEIESSTDAEQIVKFINNDDPTGNIKLSNLRTQSVANELGKLGVNTSITHREIPNNGSNVVSTQEFKKYATNSEATEQLREKTAEFRYVKIKITATFESKPEDNPNDIIKIVNSYRFEVVKVMETLGSKVTAKNKKVVDYPHKKYKCKKSKDKHAPTNCSFQR